MQMEKCFSEMKTKDMEYIDNAAINACENTEMSCSEQRRLIVRRSISIELLLLATESKKKETNFYDDNIGKNDCMCVQRPTEYYSL